MHVKNNFNQYSAPSQYLICSLGGAVVVSSFTEEEEMQPETLMLISN